MKEITTKARVLRIVKHCVSYYGNPHYYAVVETESGEIINGKTTVDGSIGYCFRNWGEGKNAAFFELTYHVTRNGNIIFDYAQNLK